MTPVRGQGSAAPGSAGCVLLPLLPQPVTDPSPQRSARPPASAAPLPRRPISTLARMLSTHDLLLLCLLPSAVLWDTTLCPGRFLRLNTEGRSWGGNEGQGRTWEKPS